MTNTAAYRLSSASFFSSVFAEQENRIFSGFLPFAVKKNRHKNISTEKKRSDISHRCQFNSSFWFLTRVVRRYILKCIIPIILKTKITSDLQTHGFEQSPVQYGWAEYKTSILLHQKVVYPILCSFCTQIHFDLFNMHHLKRAVISMLPASLYSWKSKQLHGTGMMGCSLLRMIPLTSLSLISCVQKQNFENSKMDT